MQTALGCCRDLGPKEGALWVGRGGVRSPEVCKWIQDEDGLAVRIGVVLLHSEQVQASLWKKASCRNRCQALLLGASSDAEQSRRFGPE